jgi:uncharacterized protein DUF2846
MKKITAIVAFLIAATAFLYAADGPESATLHFYRYKQMVGMAIRPSIYCDGQPLARMQNGRFIEFKVAPGHHSCYANDKQAGTEFDAKAGQDYYFRVELATGFLKGHGRLIVMTPEQAQYDLKQLTPGDEDKVVRKDLQAGNDVAPKDK